MVKYVAWADRWSGEEAVREAQDAVVRASAAQQGIHDIPTARAGWAKDQGWGTSYSYEQFAGSRPVWIWEV